MLRQETPAFLEGRRAFCIIPAPPTSSRPTLIQSTVSPIRAVPTRAAPIRAAPAPLRPPVTPTLTSLTSLPPPVTPTLTSPPPLRLPPATPTLTLPTSLSPPSDTEAPHGPPSLPLGLKCRHGPRPFCSSARSTTTPKRRTACACSPALPGAPTRPALLLLFCPGRPQSAPRPPHPARRHGPRPFCCSARGPRPGARGTKKGGRNRTEARPPPKSNQSVAAASPRQVIWLSGKSPFLKVGIRTPGNTRSSPAPKRTVFRYRAALRKVHHQANKATSRRSRTDN